MKAYVITTGTVFFLIVVSHGARLISEGVQLIEQTAFLLTSLLSVVLSAWAWRLSRKIPRRNDG